MKEALKFLNKPLTIRWYLLNPVYTTPMHLGNQATLLRDDPNNGYIDSVEQK